MFSKFLSNLFPGSKDMKVYRELCDTLRTILIPLGFTASERDVQAGLSKEITFQKDTHIVVFVFSIRERIYSLLTPNPEKGLMTDGLTPRPDNIVLYFLPCTQYNDSKKAGLQKAAKEWAGKP